MVNFDRMPCTYWSNTTKISFLQRRIIVYSIMYYEYNESCVPDSYYDSLSHQLVELQKASTKEEFEKSTYYYAMHDFDGSTGFDIPSKLNKEDYEYLFHLASVVHDRWQRNPTQKKGARK